MDGKAWKCAPGSTHVLGQVVRNGSGVRQLLLYREAVRTWLREGEEGGEVFAVVEGYVADVKCSICGRVRTWVPGEEALERLLAAVNGREVISEQ